MVTTRTKDYPYYIKSESKESYFITKILLIYTILNIQKKFRLS